MLLTQLLIQQVYKYYKHQQLALAPAEEQAYRYLLQAPAEPKRAADACSVGLLYERLGQQHYDLLDTTSESSLLHCSCHAALFMNVVL